MTWSIDPWTYLLWAMLLLTVPADWLLASVLAASVHELSHIAMIFFLGSSVKGFALRPRGAEIFTPPMEPMQELLCALAGPVGSFAMVLFCKWLPKTAICAAMQGIFNLLPIYPLDGGRALRCILAILGRKKPCKAPQFHVQ